MFKYSCGGCEIDFAKMSDWTLVCMVRYGKNEFAVEGLVERHMEWIRPLALKLCRKRGIIDPNGVDDVLQEAVEAFEEKAIERYDLNQIDKPHGRIFRNFAQQVVENRLSDYFKKEQRAKRRLGMSLEGALEARDHSGGKPGPGHGIGLALASTRDDPVIAAEKAEQSEQLNWAIGQLPSKLSRVIGLFLDDVPTSEMARRLAISQGTAWRRLQEALGQIAVLMRRWVAERPGRPSTA